MNKLQRSIAYYHLPGLFEFYELYKVFLPLFENIENIFTIGVISVLSMVLLQIVSGEEDVPGLEIMSRRKY